MCKVSERNHWSVSSTQQRETVPMLKLKPYSLTRSIQNIHRDTNCQQQRQVTAASIIQWALWPRATEFITRVGGACFQGSATPLLNGGGPLQHSQSSGTPNYVPTVWPRANCRGPEVLSTQHHVNPSELNWTDQDVLSYPKGKGKGAYTSAKVVFVGRISEGDQIERP